MWREPSVVKVLTDLKNNVLSLSRAPVPYLYRPEARAPLYHVIGTCVFRREFLYEFLAMSQTPLELCEGVEQYRILENGVRMRTAKGDFGSLGVNTPEELTKVCAMVASQEKEN